MIFTRDDKEGYLDNPIILTRCLCIYYNNKMFYYTDDVDLIPMLVHYGYHPINMKLFSELYEIFFRNLQEDSYNTTSPEALEELNNVSAIYECPLCHEVLDDIGVVSKATHTFNIKSKKYSEIEDIEDTIEYYCPKCGDTLPYNFTDNFIKERFGGK